MIVSIFVPVRRILFYDIKTKFFSVTKNEYYTVIKKKTVDIYKLFTFFLNLEKNVTKILFLIPAPDSMFFRHENSISKFSI